MTPPSTSLTIWSCLSAGLLVLLASALILSPRLLLFLSQTGTSQQRTALTSLEAFLAVHFGVYLVAVAVALVLNVGRSQFISAFSCLMRIFRRLRRPQFNQRETTNHHTLS
jgi:hypothetical protein